MLKSYEAVYSRGQLRWMHHAPPELEDEMQVIVVLDVQPPSDQRPQESIHALLQRTKGSLGRGKTLADIDREIVTMREEWEREWEK
jgi:hypothetical protein